MNDFGDLKRTLAKISQKLQPKLSTYALYLAGFHIRQMRKRIEKGIDLSGSPFAPYNPDYAKRKLKTWGKLPSWLIASYSQRSPIRSLSAQLKKPGEANIIFGNQGAAEISYYNEYGRKPRTHFGYMEAERKEIADAFRVQVSKDIERIWHES